MRSIVDYGVPKHKPILAVDYHGVINSYMSGVQSLDLADDPPTDGAIRFLIAATSSFQVCVTSARFDTNPDAREQCRAWLIKHGMPRQMITMEPNYDHIRQEIYIAGERPRATILLDDRAVQFTGTFPALRLLLQFKPWNRR